MGVHIIKKLIMDTRFTSSEALSKNLTLCFNKDDFMNENFSVDHFVSEHRKIVTLDKLRDDLTTYLKVLKSSMVELINQDYADFVNLSTNLAGLDKSIGNLCVPLGQLREEVLMVKSALDEALAIAHYHLEHQKELGDKKLILRRISTILFGVEKLESLNERAPFSCEKLNEEPVESVIERISNELIHVEFHLREIPSLLLIDNLRPKVHKIKASLRVYLDDFFIESLNRNDRMNLQFVLRINSSLGQIGELEKLFLVKIVQPYMEKVICERNLKLGITKMYNEVLNFISLKCKNLLELTTTKAGLPEAIAGYNFLVDTVWSEIFRGLESRVPVIFSPGNPDQFHKYYLASDQFIKDFESLCLNEETRQRLISSQHYASFITKWNLPVYFQIQFPKIAGPLEISLLQEYKLAKAGSEYCLAVTEILFASIEKCWSKEIFLPKLSHRFWKLTLQLVSRFSLWAGQATTKEVEVLTSGSNCEELPSLANRANCNRILVDLVNLTYLVKDVETLRIKVPLFFREVICPVLTVQGFSNICLLKDGLEGAILKLKELPVSLGKLITKQLANQCGLYLKHVADIPRLYRKTNKEVPTKPSNYINILLNPMESFVSNHHNSLSNEIFQNWSREVIDRLTEQYLTVISDVLHSVKRVEDSMKILRKTREKTPTTSGNNQAHNLISDDDKIRLQLLIDIEAYSQKIENMGLNLASFSSYSQLIELAESVRNSISNS